MNKIINIESVKETSLYKELISRKNEDTKSFVANIPTLCEEACDRAKFIPKFFSEYTLHDKTHFLRVTELMAKIIGLKVRELNDIEIGLLILSAFFHDQGMLIDNAEYQTLEENEDFLVYKDNWHVEHANYFEIRKQANLSSVSDEEKQKLFKNLNELDSGLLTDYLRETHGQRAYDFISSKYANDKLLDVYGSNLSIYLAKICLSHTKSIDWLTDNKNLRFDENIGSYKVNTIYISIILRLADILDFDSDRTPDVLFKSIHFTSPISLAEWQKHRNVNGWEISADLVRFSMNFEHPVYEKTANHFLDWIDEELNNAHGIIRKLPKNIGDFSLSIAEKVDRSRIGPINNSYLYHDLEFTISRNEIVRLLMTDNLYKNSSLFIRELLQNSLDALRLRKAIYKKDGFEWNAGEVSFRHYIDSYGQHIVECKDNGCGMDERIVTNFLGKVGRSYYRSPEFERLRTILKDKGVDFEPCSKFGIGFMSCFMIGDRIQIFTRKDYGQGFAFGKPLVIEINGLGGLIVIKEGDSKQDIGTTVKVFSREKTIVYDKWSDRIRLILTLKGYALSTEFPINASCELEEIKETYKIPTSIDKKQTFLDSLNIKSKIDVEVNLQDFDKNLSGFLRQSFLIDQNGILCLENNEAKWETQIDNKIWKDKEKFEMTLLVKKDNTNHVYNQLHGFDEGHSICLDGILVCGYPGRAEYSKYEMVGLGHISPIVHSEHSFTIDVRGNLKPELNPAREPLDKGGILNSPLGWRKLQKYISTGSGLLWEQILKYTEKGLSSEVFWRLLVIYGGNPFYIKSDLIYKLIKLPVQGNGWLKLSEISYFDKTSDTIIVTDFKENKYTIEFPEEIINWGKTNINGTDFKYWVSNLLICMSELHYSDINCKLKIRETYNKDELPNDCAVVKGLSSLRFIPYLGVEKEYITSLSFPDLLNSKNSLVKEIVKNNLISNKDELCEFLEIFIFKLCNLIQDLQKEDKLFVVSENWGALKYPALLFQNINWDKYKNEFKPPYKIVDKNGDTIEIRKEHFENWAKHKPIKDCQHRTRGHK
jgi:Molecular chaperone, HSP90 family